MSRSFGERLFTRRPPIAISPLLIVSSPAIMLSRVDLPQPEGPTRIKNSPSSTSMLIPLSTSTEPKRLITFLIESAPMLSAFDGAGSQPAQEIFSGDDVDEQGRQSGDDGCGHVYVVFLDTGGGVHQVVQGHGDRLTLAGGEHHAEQEVVPDLGELPYHADDNDGRRQRENNPPENREETRAVDAGSLGELGRYRYVKVSEEQRGEGQAID